MPFGGGLNSQSRYVFEKGIGEYMEMAKRAV